MGHSGHSFESHLYELLRPAGAEEKTIPHPQITKAAEVQALFDVDDEAVSITGLMDALKVSSMTGTPFRAPIEKAVAHTAVQKISEPLPTSTWMPEVTIRPRPGSPLDTSEPLAKRYGHDYTRAEARQGVKDWMVHKISEGSTVEELAEIFSDSDPRYSAFIRELGGEL